VNTNHWSTSLSPRGLAVWDNVQQIARTTPGRVAVSIDSDRLSYDQIVKEIDARASWLRGQLEIGADVRVLPVIVNRSVDSVLALLTCLAGEIPFTVFDSSMPPARRSAMHEMLSNPLPTWDATSTTTDGAAIDGAFRFLDNVVDQQKPSGDGALSEPLRAEIVFFTSGTTGVPKAVAVTRESIRAWIAALPSLAEDFDHNRELTTFSLAPFSFAHGLTQINQILDGMALVSVDASKHSPRALLDMMVAENPSHMVLTPQLARVFGQLSAPPETKVSKTIAVMLAGEATRFEHLHAISRFFPDTTRYEHWYGATESGGALGYQATLDGVPEAGRVPLRPVFGEEKVNLVPADEFLLGTVEVWASGDIAEGYLRNPELMEERFIVRDGKRWWRSGDLLRSVGDGEYLHVGRKDDVVKINGHLVSTSEIEMGLSNDDDVSSTAVIAFERGETTALAAFVILAEGSTTTVQQIRERLSHVIPAYMMPAQIHRVEKFETTIAGKVDRKALLEMARLGETR